jgi:hypothetical protein
VDIDARTLACWAENAWDDCAATPASFRAQLRLMERGAASLFASGSIGSVSKNSASQSYAGSGFGRYSVVQIQQAFRMLIELYDSELWETQCLFNLAQTYPTNQCGINFILKYLNYAADPDDAVYDRITRKLIPVESYEVDLSYLRLQPTLGAWPTPGTW